MKRTSAFLSLVVTGWLFAVSSLQGAAGFRVVLLGTGTPAPEMNRFGASILVEAGDERLLFDAGRGAMQRLNQIDDRDVTNLFLTHLHSDHTVGIPDIFLTGWLLRRRTVPFNVWGPKGTADMLSHIRAAYAFDIGIRVSDDGRNPDGARVDAHDIEEGVVFNKNGVKVTAFTVDHRPVEPAFGYRVDYNGHSVALSGDTRFSENLITHATGVDLLIHEIAANSDPSVTQENNRVFAHHTLPEQAATVFTRTHPKLAVYSHIIAVGLTDQQLIDVTRKGYQGPVVAGADLMTFEIGDTVTIGQIAPRP
jgi:ribonuclease Z